MSFNFFGDALVKLEYHKEAADVVDVADVVVVDVADVEPDVC